LSDKKQEGNFIKICLYLKIIHPSTLKLSSCAKASSYAKAMADKSADRMADKPLDN